MEPLLVVRSAVFGTGIPSQLEAYPDGVEVRTATPPNLDVQKVLYEQIAQVYVKYPMFRILWPFSDLQLETRGGDVLLVRGLTHRDAESAAAFVRDRAASARAASGGGVSAPPDIPAQIRQLAELRDSGAITVEEFETKKRDLLDRM
jgi:hypothetical protein